MSKNEFTIILLLMLLLSTADIIETRSSWKIISEQATQISELEQRLDTLGQAQSVINMDVHKQLQGLEGVPETLKNLEHRLEQEENSQDYLQFLVEEGYLIK
jgi:hypothetical protein